MSRILAIDDTPDNLISIKALLGIMIKSCEVLTAGSGREGIETALREQPDVILLDIHMPELDGFQVCRILKSDPRTTAIPVVILTALKTGSHHRVKALELGADAFLTKPINESELAAQVKAMLRIKAAEDLLRNENERLEILVEKRVRELIIANEQLVMETDERKTVQKTLTESENRFRTMIEKSPLPMLITDSSQNIVFLNDKFIERFGYTLEDIGTADQWWMTAYPDPAYREKVRKSWETAVNIAEATGKDINMQVCEILTKTREKKTCEVNMVPLGDVSLIVMNDITDRIAVETQRMQLEKQLQQAQKMEAVGALAGGIAHDFNNILSPLIGFTELLKEDIPEASPLNESVDEILKASFRARDLVRQILSFSRQMDQEVMPIKLHPIVKETLLLSKAIIPTTITICNDIDRTCPAVLADATQIHQLVMNLITNAFHAMEETGGTLTVYLKHRELSPQETRDLDLVPGQYICLGIKDTGVGMDENVLARIFDPYFTTKGITKGTGLGLSVVHGIVKNYMGEISVSSRIGEGTEFKVYLPAVQNEIEPEKVHVKSPLPKGKGRILLVDDEPHIIKIEKQMLERLGYEVIPMENPVETFELFSARPNHFDLVITDMTMPGITGDILAMKLMNIRPDLPIIICTGFSDQINHESAMQMGISALLMKPVLTSDLAHAVRNALKKTDKAQNHK